VSVEGRPEKRDGARDGGDDEQMREASQHRQAERDEEKGLEMDREVQMLDESSVTIKEREDHGEHG
jgi:hypothetical protein